MDPRELDHLVWDRDLLAYQALGRLRYLLDAGLLPQHSVDGVRALVARYDQLTTQMGAGDASDAIGPGPGKREMNATQASARNTP